MKIALVMFVVYATLPVVLTIFIKFKNKFIRVSDIDVVDFDEKIKYLNKHEEIKKTYRNYLFFNYLFSFFLYLFFIILPIASMNSRYGNNSMWFSMAVLYILLIVSGYGISMVVSYVIIYIFNFLFQSSVSLKYYDVFSLNINNVFEPMYPQIKKMKDLKTLKFHDHLCYLLSVFYFLFLAVFLVIANYIYK
jgi:hypothetical protein